MNKKYYMLYKKENMMKKMKKVNGVYFEKNKEKKEIKIKWELQQCDME